MRGFLSLARHEMSMSLRRRALWIAYALLFALHTVILFSPPPLGEWVAGEAVAPDAIWAVAGQFLAAVNVLFPIVAGILTADRLPRDLRLGMRELQESTPLGAGAYVLAKYAGALAACLLPLLAWVLAIAALLTAMGHTPPAFLIAAPVAFVAITVPAFAFVVAFSLACPLVIPPSVYQVLFTGYWFWANFVPPQLFPTLNGTLLTPNGLFALQGFFGGKVSEAISGPGGYGARDAVANLAVLAACDVAVLVLLTSALRRRVRLA